MEFITYTRDNKHIKVDLDFVEAHISSTKGIDSKLIESVYGNAVIKWNFEFETRVSGIKNLEVVATSIGLDVVVEHYTSHDPDNDDLIETEFDLSEHIKDFKIETETNFNFAQGCVYVEAVEINFRSKTILVNF